MEKIGHRGAMGYVAENTLASIEKAIELKVEAIEIDVHVCKSGEIIVIHDPKINRTTTGKGKVRDLTYNQIQKVNSEGFQIPLLIEVLAFCEGKCNLHIELKGKGTAIKVAGLIEEFVNEGKWKYDQIFVSSFVTSRLKKIKKYNSNIRLGIIASKRTSKTLKKTVKNGYEVMYIYHKKIKPHFVRIAKLKKVKVYAWTVNESTDIKKVKRLEIQGIISDFPDRL